MKKNEEKFYDPDVNREKRFSLVTPVRRKFAALLQRWRGETARIQEMHTIETVFAEVSAKVDACLAEMGDSVDVSNVESWFNAQWDEKNPFGAALILLVKEGGCHFTFRSSYLRSYSYVLLVLRISAFPNFCLC